MKLENCKFIIIEKSAGSACKVEVKSGPRKRKAKPISDSWMLSDCEAVCSNCGSRSKVVYGRNKCELCRAPIRYDCLACSKSYRSYNELSRHTIVKHHSTSSVERYDCAKCQKSFLLKKRLRDHERAYCSVAARTYRCEHCPYETSIKSNLASHARTQHFSVYFPHRSCECGKIFKSSSSWTRHKRHHCFNKIKLKCHLCGSSYNRKDYLRKHILNQHASFL
ncbi:hypothetical protein TKK_0011023 [Trichogramma kaykai]